MRVVEVSELGGPEVLRVAARPKPEPAPTEVLVAVHAAGVNPVDWKVRRGGGFLGEPPFVVGWDVAGVVEAVAGGVTWLAPGDEVLGMPWFPRQAGAYGEYVTAPARHFVRKPASLGFAEAAGLPLAGLTAWQALVDTADVQPGQRVLVNGAAGGVGHLAVQIAKARGAHVLGTARAAKHDFLRSLGVDEPIDYTTGDVAAQAGPVDVVFDMIGGAHTATLAPAVREGGTVIPLTGGLTEETAELARARGARATGLLVEPDHAGLAGLVALIESGALRVHVERTFPLAQAAEAHRLGEAGHVSGKLVLTVRD
ncbi:NADP-dependent oxidoreductase [Labedaea rhizosphaerae]|uniref:NADPH:quinone reductase-like Zn-dependent oxidoreductase n=1 Tax=Labedaea rhizosphaerae TaxID=598644 RepID=A0A4R6SN57_LABRH|nr:NADP-dependent oxidoreductase [Labedaea rhizosphaerae]TDQ04623.1 NADPH:quinone reductase-like Zn-dependent oxidoreductase [Labedaea rhizosphaerae]